MVIGLQGAIWQGLGEANAAFARMNAGMDLAARANVEQASAILIREAMSNFEGAHRRGEPHRGGPKPNVVTGNLRRSIQAQSLIHDGPGRYSREVGPTAVYARAIELGREGHNRAYPYFGPAAKTIRQRMPAIAMENWARYIT